MRISGNPSRIAILAIAAFAALASPAFAQREARILPGANSRAPINIEAEKLDYFDKEQKLVYSSNVFAQQDDSTLKASVLTIFLSGSPAQSGEPSGSAGANSDVRRMEAEGPVTITSKDQVGQGDSAVYDKGENKLYLIGNVSLAQRSNTIRGSKDARLVYDLASGHAQIVGGLSSQITPGSDDPAKKKPEPKPAPQPKK